MHVSFIKLTQNKIQKLESNLLKSYLKKSSLFADAVNSIWFQAAMKLNLEGFWLVTQVPHEQQTICESEYHLEMAPLWLETLWQHKRKERCQ